MIADPYEFLFRDIVGIWFAKWNEYNIKFTICIRVSFLKKNIRYYWRKILMIARWLMPF